MGLGVAIGAAAARPDSTTVLFAGDGGLSMVLGDIESLARCGLPLVVVAMNDRAYGAERIHLEADGLPGDYANLGEIHFGQVATALGMDAATIRGIHELRAIGPQLHGRTEPILLDCKLRREITAARLRW